MFLRYVSRLAGDEEEGKMIHGVSTSRISHGGSRTEKKKEMMKKFIRCTPKCKLSFCSFLKFQSMEEGDKPKVTILHEEERGKEREGQGE